MLLSVSSRQRSSTAIQQKKLDDRRAGRRVRRHFAIGQRPYRSGARPCRDSTDWTGAKVRISLMRSPSRTSLLDYAHPSFTQFLSC